MEYKVKKCEYEEKCGGCKYSLDEYEKSLDEKKKYVDGLFKEKVSKNFSVKEIIGMENPYSYRNKAKYVFGHKNGKYVMGFYEESTHNIINISKCSLQNSILNEIAEYVFSLIKKYKVKIFDEDKRSGFLRHLMIRIAENTGEVMVVFVTANAKMSRGKDIVKDVTAKYPLVKSIVQNINEEETNIVLGNKCYDLYGKGYIVDKVNGIKFKISCNSFYQVNTSGMKVLYEEAIKEANISKEDIVYDLYSGIGTISLFASKYARKVVGIEVVDSAVKDAKFNASLNKITNVNFICDKVEEALIRIMKNHNGADIVIVDPPRSGLHKKVIDAILDMMPNKVIYISCNPETLVRDLNELKSTYDIVNAKCVDMFPFTSHVECVCVLNRR